MLSLSLFLSLCCSLSSLQSLFLAQFHDQIVIISFEVHFQTSLNAITGFLSKADFDFPFTDLKNKYYPDFFLCYEMFWEENLEAGNTLKNQSLRKIVKRTRCHKSHFYQMYLLKYGFESKYFLAHPLECWC